MSAGFLAHGEAVFAKVDGRDVAVRYTGTIQDITARKDAEARLTESEARLRLAIDAARLAVWEIDSTTRTLKASPELNRILGFPEYQVLSIDEVEARYPPGERVRLQAAGQAALERGEHYIQVEFRYLWPDQSTRWLLLRADILFGPDGKPSGALGVLLDITQQKETEQHRQLLVGELQHRVNNTLALVAALANQTFRGGNAEGDTPGALAAFSARLFALGQAHTLLTQKSWRSADLGEIVKGALAPYRDEGRIDVSGPKVQLASRRALALSLALNELATNAMKYGALSNLHGRIEVRWWIEPEAAGQHLHMRWTESGGPTVLPPSRTSFGTRLIREMMAADFNGAVDVQYPPTGMVCTLRAPLADASQEAN